MISDAEPHAERQGEAARQGRARRRPSFRARVLALVTGTVGLGGLVICNVLTLHDLHQGERTVDYQDRPSMEQMLDEYRAFQDDLTSKLDERFGERSWREPPNDPGFDWWDCGDPAFADGASAALPAVGFDGAYPPDRWRSVRDLVIEIGKQHGFSVVTVIIDRPGALDFTGQDPRYGASYDFGMGKNTSFGIITGCHRWDTPPSPGS